MGFVKADTEIPSSILNKIMHNNLLIDDTNEWKSSEL